MKAKATQVPPPQDAASPCEKLPPHALIIAERADETPADARGRALVDPATNSASAMQPFQSEFLGEDVALMATIEEINRVTAAVKDGDVSGLEAMLVSQAITLQTLFTSLARRAQNQTYQAKFDSYLGLAFKAQAQSRATIQAVADLKYPRQVAFVKQANIANGNQQVNNGVTAPEKLPVRGKSELLEAENEKWVDAGTPSSASRADPRVAAMAKLDRPTH